MAKNKSKGKPQRFDAVPNDVSDWGDRKGFTNADFTRPFKVAGVEVDLDSLPDMFGSDEPSEGGKRASLRKH